MSYPTRAECAEALSVLDRVHSQDVTRLKAPALRRQMEGFATLVDQVLPSDEVIARINAEELSEMEVALPKPKKKWRNIKHK